MPTERRSHTRRDAEAPKRKPRKSRKPAAKAHPERIGLRRELLGMSLLVLAALLLLALVTYSPADLGAELPPANLAGRVGAWCAAQLLAAFGFAAYVLTLGLGAFGVVLAVRRSWAVKLKEGAGLVLLIACAGVLAELLFAGLWAARTDYTPGGLLGKWLVDLAAPSLARTGTGVLAAFGAFVALVMAADLPPWQSARWSVGLAWRGLRAFARGLAWSVRSVRDQWSRENEAEPRRLPDWAHEREAKLPKAAKPKAETPKAEAPKREAAKSEASAVSEEEAPFAPPEANALPEIVHAGLDEEPEAEPAPAPPAPAEEDDEATIGEELQPGAEPQIVDSRPPRPDEDEIGDDALDVDDEAPLAEYALPPMSLLDYTNEGRGVIDREHLYNNARLLERTLLDYKIEAQVKEIHPGPVVTMYEVAPSRGTKLSRIANLEDDLAMALAALKVRIVAPIPGKSVVGIEVPSADRETVYLKEIIGHKTFADSKSKLTVALGKDIFGYPVVADLQKMPHLLIAGATGAGKSVGVNGMILSILFRNPPEDVKFILVDPKRLEFNFYEDIPHLLLPVVTDPKQAALALAWATHEMDNRYKLLSEWGVKNIDSFNRLVRRMEEARASRGGDLDRMIEEFGASEGGDLRTLAKKLKSSPMPEKMPFIVVVIDELADLMMVAGKEVETSIARLAQLARASGIHLIVATQRPSTDVLTGLIKNNFPARMSFRVSQKVDSRTILDRNGAEALLGRGDMLYLPGSGELTRIHGAFVSEEETWRVVDFIKRQRKPTYQRDILERIEEKAAEEEAEAGEYDSEYDKAVQIVCETGKASISMLQRRLRVGYNRAARMIEKMEEEGVVGASDGVKGRPVYGRPIPRD